MSSYPKLSSVKVVSEVLTYATKKELEHATGNDISDMAAKKNFIAVKTEFDKTHFNKLTNVPTRFNNLKTKLDDSNVGRLKYIPVKLKKLSDVVGMKLLKIQNSTQ